MKSNWLRVVIVVTASILKPSFRAAAHGEWRRRSTERWALSALKAKNSVAGDLKQKSINHEIRSQANTEREAAVPSPPKLTPSTTVSPPQCLLSLTLTDHFRLGTKHARLKAINLQWKAFNLFGFNLNFGATIYRRNFDAAIRGAASLVLQFLYFRPPCPIAPLPPSLWLLLANYKFGTRNRQFQIVLRRVRC